MLKDGHECAIQRNHLAHYIHGTGNMAPFMGSPSHLDGNPEGEKVEKKREEKNEGRNLKGTRHVAQTVLQRCLGLPALRSAPILHSVDRALMGPVDYQFAVISTPLPGLYPWRQ